MSIDPIYQDDFDILVSAGAGTGKTFTLKKRIARKISQGKGDLRKMLILTFTNLAAASMRNKIAEELKDPCYADNKFVQQQLKYLAGADILTFDAFNQRLLKKYFYKIPGFDPNFQVVAGGALNYELNLAIDNVLENNFSPENKDNALWKKFLSTYTLKDDDKIRNLIKKGIYVLQKKANPEDNVKAWIADAENDNASIVAMGRAYVDRLSKDNEEKYRRFVHALEEINDAVDAGILPGATKFNQIYVDNMPLIDGAKTLDDYKMVIDLYDHKSILRGKTSEEEKQHPAVTTFKDIKSSWVKALRELCAYQEDNRWVDILKKQGIYRKLLVEIVWKVFKIYEKQKESNHVYEFSDLNQIALRLLSTDPSVRHDVARSYEDIMIDEYQDNSDLQEVFVNLLRNDTAFEGHLFFVGDIKQSIYRFRNANPKNFSDRDERYQNHEDGGVRATLPKNFRSAPMVIDYVNTVFSTLMTKEFGGTNYTQGHALGKGKEIEYGKINLPVRSLEYTFGIGGNTPSMKYEALIVADDILNRIDRQESVTLVDPKTGKEDTRVLGFGDFAIICDRGTQFDVVAEVFKEKHIPLSVQQDENEDASTLIYLLKNLLILYCKILQWLPLGKADFSDQTFLHSYLSVVRGPVKKKDGSYYNENQINELFKPKEKDFSEDDLYRRMRDLAKAYQHYPLDFAYREIIKEFRVLEVCEEMEDASADYRFLVAFDSIIGSMTALRYDGEKAVQFLSNSKFDENLRAKLSVNTATHEQAVTLINMHKSKGLQYPIVYFVGLGKKYNDADNKENSFFTQEYGPILPFVFSDLGNSTEATVMNNPAILEYKKISTKEDRSENLRKLYVALTRAEYQINLIRRRDGEVKLNDDPSSYNNMDSLLAHVENAHPDVIDSSNVIVYQNVHQHAFHEPFVVEPNDQKEIPFRYDEPLKEVIYESKTKDTASKGKADGKVSKKILQKGTEVHRALEATDFHDPDIEHATSFIKAKDTRRCVQNFLRSDLWARYSSYEVHKEVHYLDHLDPTKEGSVDLLLLGEKMVIVDYKLRHIDDAAYVEQLKTYRSNMLASYPQYQEKDVELHLFAVMTGQDEVVK